MAKATRLWDSDSLNQKAARLWYDDSKALPSPQDPAGVVTCRSTLPMLHSTFLTGVAS